MALRACSRVFSRAVLRTPVAASVPSRALSTVFESREHAEESRYIREQEKSRKEQMRAEMERILALEDHHEEKKELTELLDKSTVEKSWIAKYGLDDWKFALPLGLLIGIPAVSTELLIIDAETQLTACFILFCSTLYTQVGGMIGQSLDDRGKEISEELRTLDDAMKSQLAGAIASNQLALSLDTDLKERMQLVDDLAATQAELLNHKEQHNYRDAIVKKLESLSALESATTSALRARTIETVKKDVLDRFNNDRAAKDAALDQAILVLSTGAKGNMGKDVVGQAFSDALKNYKTKYEANKEPDEILVKMEKEMAAIAQAPIVDSKGGNVYVTHRL